MSAQYQHIKGRSRHLLLDIVRMRVFFLNLFANSKIKRTRFPGDQWRVRVGLSIQNGQQYTELRLPEQSRKPILSSG
jgi:hypothetical protein